MLRLLAAEPEFASCESLRLICSAGEPLHAELCQRLIARTSAEIWNTYGPTECSIDVLAQRFDPAQLRGPVPIGRPIDNARYVLLPTGSEGEGEPLHESACAAPESAAAIGTRRARRSGLPDPYGPPGSQCTAQATWCGCGRRRARLRRPGRLPGEVHGVRIEPAEVEAVLERIPRSSRPPCARSPAPRRRPRLAAWVVVRRPGLAATLPGYLRELLPAAFVPALISEIDALPRTAAANPSRAAAGSPTGPRRPARTPGAGARDGRGAHRPVGLGQLLGARRPVPDDDFFRLGGDSLLLTRLAAKLTRPQG